MTASSREYVDYLLDLLAPLGRLSSGRFFGGDSLKLDAVQFAMVMGNTLFFVVDDSTRANYEQKGMGCFWYHTKKKRVNVRKYYEVPAELIDDQNSLIEWARQSVQVARSLKKHGKTK